MQLTHNPLTPRRFARLLADTQPPEGPLAIAVSGGPDSLALLILLAQWRDAQHPQRTIFALTVNHDMRIDAASEARHAALTAKKLRIPHITLRWRGDKPKTAIQEKARNARYKILADWCERNRVPAILLAHHMDDQAATFLFRLARGSSIHGLAAMSPRTEINGMLILRPLLSVPRSHLQDTLRAHNISWRCDPSNHDPAFARTHLNTALTRLPVSRIAAAAASCRDMRRRIDKAAQKLLLQDAKIQKTGCILSLPLFRAAPPPVARAALTQILSAVGGRKPRAAKIKSLHQSLLAPQTPPATLAGCRLIPRQSQLIIRPEKPPRRNAPFIRSWLSRQKPLSYKNDPFPLISGL